MGNKTEKTYHYFGRGNSEYWPGTQGAPNGLVPDSVRFSDVYSRIGSNNPNYQQVIKSGGDATGSMVVTAQETFFSRPHLEVGWKSKQYTPWRLGTTIKANMLNFGNGVGSHVNRPGSLFMSDVSNKALIGIIKKIRKHENGDFSGPTFAGELRETLHMIKSPFSALRLKTGLFTDLHKRILRDRSKANKRGRVKQLDDWSKVISDTWLEWTFGAAPLINDIKGLLDAYLESKLKQFPKGYKRLSHRFVDDYMETPIVGADNIWTGCSLRYKYNRARHYQGGVQYVVWIDEDLIFHGSSSIERLLDLSKIRLDEIVPTAWELMPWSFLIDYFTNIGDVLGSTFNYNRNIVFGKRTQLERVVQFDVPLSAYVTSPNEEYVIKAEPWTYTSSYMRLERAKFSTLGFPQLSVSLPSIGQATNIAALFRSLSQRNPFKGQTLS